MVDRDDCVCAAVYGSKHTFLGLSYVADLTVCYANNCILSRIVVPHLAGSGAGTTRHQFDTGTIIGDVDVYRLYNAADVIQNWLSVSAKCAVRDYSIPDET